MKRPLRRFNIEYEMRDDDVAHLCHDLNITVQAARGLLVNQNQDAVRTLIEQRGGHLSKRQRAELIARITHTQCFARQRQRQAHAQVRQRARKA